MEWKNLEAVSQLESIVEESKTNPVVIFKHSTRCTISGAALDRLERNWKKDSAAPRQFYFLDLLSHRDISNRIAELFGVEHQSPQVLIISQGKAIYDESHLGIDYSTIKGVLSDQLA